MPKREIVVSAAAPAIGPYSRAIEAKPWVFLSGQIGLDPKTGNLVEGGIREQTARALQNVDEVLKAARLDYSNVVKTTVFMKDMAQFSEMNEVYAKYFKAPYPARSTVGVAALPKGALVEIEAVALAPNV